MAIINFDATQIAPDTGVQDPLPAGWYKAIVDNSEIKQTKLNTGVYLEVRFSVIEGPHTGKKVFSRYNLRNSNQQAQEIAQRQLSALAHATGVLQIADSSALHNIPVQIKVKLQQATAEYEAQNVLVAVKNINEAIEPVPGLMAAMTPQQTKAAGFANVPVFSTPAMAPQAPVAPAMQPQAATPPWAAAPVAQAPAPLQPAPVTQDAIGTQAQNSVPPWAMKNN